MLGFSVYEGGIVKSVGPYLEGLDIVAVPKVECWDALVSWLGDIGIYMPRLRVQVEVRKKGFACYICLGL